MMVRAIAAAFVWVVVGGAAQAQDASAGEKSFGKCRACHQMGESAKNGIGPVLNGLFGRKSGTVPGFSYTAANRDAEITWEPGVFAEYIKDPKAKMPGTRMVFAGIKNEKEIADLTAYLQQFDAAGKKSGS